MKHHKMSNHRDIGIGTTSDEWSDYFSVDNSKSHDVGLQCDLEYLLSSSSSSPQARKRRKIDGDHHGGSDEDDDLLDGGSVAPSSSRRQDRVIGDGAASFAANHVMSMAFKARAAEANKAAERKRTELDEMMRQLAKERQEMQEGRLGVEAQLRDELDALRGKLFSQESATLALKKRSDAERRSAVDRSAILEKRLSEKSSELTRALNDNVNLNGAAKQYAAQINALELKLRKAQEALSSSSGNTINNSTSFAGESSVGSPTASEGGGGMGGRRFSQFSSSESVASARSRKSRAPPSTAGSIKPFSSSSSSQRRQSAMQRRHSTLTGGGGGGQSQHDLLEAAGDEIARSNSLFGGQLSAIPFVDDFGDDGGDSTMTGAAAGGGGIRNWIETTKSPAKQSKAPVLRSALRSSNRADGDNNRAASLGRRASRLTLVSEEGEMTPTKKPALATPTKTPTGKKSAASVASNITSSPASKSAAQKTTNVENLPLSPSIVIEPHSGKTTPTSPTLAVDPKAARDRSRSPSLGGETTPFAPWAAASTPPPGEENAAAPSSSTSSPPPPPAERKLSLKTPILVDSASQTETETASGNDDAALQQLRDKVVGLEQELELLRAEHEKQHQQRSEEKEKQEEAGGEAADRNDADGADDDDTSAKKQLDDGEKKKEDTQPKQEDDHDSRGGKRSRSGRRGLRNEKQEQEHVQRVEHININVTRHVGNDTVVNGAFVNTLAEQRRALILSERVLKALTIQLDQVSKQQQISTAASSALEQQHQSPPPLQMDDLQKALSFERQQHARDIAEMREGFAARETQLYQLLQMALQGMDVRSQYNHFAASTPGAPVAALDFSNVSPLVAQHKMPLSSSPAAAAAQNETHQQQQQQQQNFDTEEASYHRHHQRHHANQNQPHFGLQGHGVRVPVAPYSSSSSGLKHHTTARPQSAARVHNSSAQAPPPASPLQQFVVASSSSSSSTHRPPSASSAAHSARPPSANLKPRYAHYASLVQMK